MVYVCNASIFYVPSSMASMQQRYLDQSLRGPKLVTAARNLTQLGPRPVPARKNILSPKISVFNCHLESLIRESFHGTEFL